MRPPWSVGQDVRTVFWQLLLLLLRKDRGPSPVHDDGLHSFGRETVRHAH